MKNKTTKFIITEKNGKYFLRFSSHHKPIPVNIVWLQPFNQKNSGVSIINYKKKEILYLPNLKQVTSKNKKLIIRALKERTLLPIITRIKKITVNFGIRYWQVETNIGPHLFAMMRPSKYITEITADRIIVKDTFNNYYLIKSISKLDKNSQKQLSIVL